MKDITNIQELNYVSGGYKSYFSQADLDSHTRSHGIFIGVLGAIVGIGLSIHSANLYFTGLSTLAGTIVGYNLGYKTSNTYLAKPGYYEYRWSEGGYKIPIITA